MAAVILTRDVLSCDRLPAVCMCCGAPATLFLKQRLALRSPWVLMLAWFAGPLALLLFERGVARVALDVPLCPTHQHHWLKRRIFNIAAGIAWFWMFAGVIFLPSVLGKEHTASLWLGMTFLVVFWILAVLAMDAWMIGLGNIGPRGVTLRNVAPAFRDAVLDMASALRAGEHPKNSEAF